jgi:hypothetical protein
VVLAKAVVGVVVHSEAVWAEEGAADKQRTLRALP